jgi:DNA-binding MarR family transcriptional regulator
VPMSDEPVQQRVASGIRELIASAILFNDQVAAKVGMSHGEMQSLHLLQLHGSMTPGQLSDLTGLSTGAITALIDRLQGAGLATRAPHPTDRRKVVVSADQDRINALLGPHYAGWAEHLSQVIGAFDSAELETIARFFARLSEPDPAPGPQNQSADPTDR